jgi:hypothetical protein
MVLNGNIKKKTVFDWFKEITTDKRPWSFFDDDFKKEFNVFLIHKIVSMTEAYIDVANIGQSLPYTDKEKIYKFYCEFLPKKSIYSKYIKGVKTKPNENLLKYISKFYECSFREAEEYIQILKKEDIQDILNRYGIEDKEIKKLLK